MGQLMTKKLKYDPSIQIISPIDLDRHHALKIACFSDTHLLRPKLSEPVDLLIHAGDLFNYDSNKNHLPIMSDYFLSLQTETLIFIAGNHDRLFLQKDLKQSFVKGLQAKSFFK